MKVKTTAENRKDVVKAMEEILNEKAKYQGPPSFGYAIGEFTVDRDGNVEHESGDAILKMKNELAARGLAGEEADSLNIEFPLEGFTAEGIKNLLFMIHSKQYLLEKAVGKAVFKISDKLVERLNAEEVLSMEQVIQAAAEENAEGITFQEDTVSFCGFPMNPEETNAYMELAASMVKTAKEAKRISPKETIEENEKYYMRVWLVRIGLAGNDKKDTRKVLFSRLKGHTAFRTEGDKEKWNMNQKAKKQGGKESGI
uniref:phage terminase small subunit P27 family n=1 Tax=Agathobacter sp. TaxID=2021311 RepID=UPI00405691E5